MFDPKFKNLCIVCSFVEKEQGVAFLENYDGKTLYPMWVKCYKHLHPLVKLNKNFFDQDILK
jgi:hypothetical protein